MTSKPRRLQFESLDQIVLELNQLLTGGYFQAGNWNLAQTCCHLNDWIGFSLDGYPKAPPPIRLLLWLMKITSGKRQFESVLKNGFRERLPTMPQTVHDADCNSDVKAVKELIDTLHRFGNSSAAIHPSPLYGPLTYDEAKQLHLVHCAHHLRNLIPTSSDKSGESG